MELKLLFSYFLFSFLIFFPKQYYTNKYIECPIVRPQMPTKMDQDPLYFVENIKDLVY